MPKVTILVRGAPRSCLFIKNCTLALQIGKAYESARSNQSGDLEFSTEFEWAPDRQGDLHARGPAIVRQNDGKRFIYLAWLDEKGAMFRRIKLFVRQFATPPQQGPFLVTLSGIDGKGMPACSTAKVIEEV